MHWINNCNIPLTNKKNHLNKVVSCFFFYLSIHTINCVKIDVNKNTHSKYLAIGHKIVGNIHAGYPYIIVGVHSTIVVIKFNASATAYKEICIQTFFFQKNY